MKRDMELVRQILIAIGDSEFWSDMGLPLIEGHSIDEVRHHVLIMEDAGLLSLVEGRKTEDLFGQTEDLELRLTWEGHEFLEKIRDEKIWNSILKTTKEKTGGLSFEIIKALLIATLTKAVGL